MKNKFIPIIIGLLALSLIASRLIVSRTSRPDNSPDQKIKITASFYPLYFFASEIAGDRADVYNLTPAGAEVHDYELTARDAARLVDSRLVILNGGQLEPWADKIKNTLLNTDAKVITVGENFSDLPRALTGDPHQWLAPRLAQKIAANIGRELMAIDPDNAPYYQAQSQALQDRLARLDQKFRGGLSNCAGYDIITAHAAFGYLAEAYGLRQVAVAGLSPDEEPSPRQLASVADFAKTNRVKYIFFESLTSPKLSEAIAREVGAETLVLNPIEGLSATALAQGKNYFTEMENNLINLRIALQCR